MKTIGLIGGMSWESSAQYYRLINEGVRLQLGPSSSARCILWSFDFSEIEILQSKQEWSALADRMIDAAKRLEQAGADFIVICTNTMHKLAPQVESNIEVPLLHIADPTGQSLVRRGFRKAGLLGTSFTMEQSFYKTRLSDNFGLDVIVPDEIGRGKVHRIIYEELISGTTSPASRRVFQDVMNQLVRDGAEAIVLGCTEIMLLVGSDDAKIPILDTTALHANAAIKFALE